MPESIVQRVLDCIREPAQDGFGRLALDVFAFQYVNNAAYRRFCARRGVTPDTISTWEEIPAVPTGAFKLLDLSCVRPEQVFLTSGTSQGSESRGRHGFPWLEVYHTSVLTNFAAHLLPDGARPRMLILAPSPDLLPISSLSHMLEVVRTAYGAGESGYFMGEKGIDISGLLGALKEIEARQDPVCLLGTSFAFVHLLDTCLADGWRFRLPEGSRLMDTGGFKGRSREVSRQELLCLYQKVFGIPDACCVNEYGMTEMGSQFYDNTLIDRVLGRSRPRFKAIPSWVRTRILDPATLEKLPEGEVGLLIHYDLANCGSVMAVETEDLGYRIEEGFEIVGRAPGAEVRGCSLTVEELQESR
ncbi:MAG: long-chain fatty acid--CoA ligase [Candidatus Methylomirabilales bacterium]